MITSTASQPSLNNHGFDILTQHYQLKLAFDRFGLQGHYRFIKACIVSGIDHPECIIEKAVGISGEGVREQIEDALLAGDYKLWETGPTGALYALFDENDYCPN